MRKRVQSERIELSGIQKLDSILVDNRDGEECTQNDQSTTSPLGQRNDTSLALSLQPYQSLSQP